jgi:V/A-type H+-transporting ATPase subunit D
MELTRLKKKLASARKGHKLLKDKRDELMRQFMELVRENQSLRAEAEAEIKLANEHMLIAGSVMQTAALETALLMPKQELSLDVQEKNIMSVKSPVFKTKLRTHDENDIYSYGMAFTSSDLDGAVKALSEVYPKLLRLAEIEKSCQLLADEIEKTRRRVNALEHIMIPDYEDTIKYITMKLSENERSSSASLMKVKEMTLEKSHGYNK